MFLNWFQQKKGESVDPKHEKLIKLMKLENFNNPDITFKDSLIYMTIFNPDKISIDPQDCNIIISGFVNLELNMKKYKMLVMIKLHQSYPEFQPLVYIKNKTLNDNSIILNTHYQDFDQEYIMLKLVSLEKWYQVKIPENVCREIVETLTNHFPFIQKEQDKQLNLLEINNNQPIQSQSKQDQKQVQQQEQKSESQPTAIPIIPKTKDDEYVLRICRNALQLKSIVVKDTIKEQKYNWFQLVEQYKLLQEERQILNIKRININQAIKLSQQEIQNQNQWLELEGKTIYDIPTNNEQILELYAEQRALRDVLVQIRLNLKENDTCMLDFEQAKGLCQQYSRWMFYNQLLLNKILK